MFKSFHVVYRISSTHTLQNILCGRYYFITYVICNNLYIKYRCILNIPLSIQTGLKLTMKSKLILNFCFLSLPWWVLELETCVIIPVFCSAVHGIQNFTKRALCHPSHLPGPWISEELSLYYFLWSFAYITLSKMRNTLLHISLPLLLALVRRCKGSFGENHHHRPSCGLAK